MRQEWLNAFFSKYGFLCSLHWFPLQLCWAVLFILAACNLKHLTDLSFSVSGYVCRLAQFRKVNIPWAMLAMDRGRDKMHFHLQRENPEAHSTRFCRTSPAPLKSFTHSGHKHGDSALIASSSSSGSLSPLPYSCSLESPHQSTTCTQVPISGFAVTGNSNTSLLY